MAVVAEAPQGDKDGESRCGDSLAMTHKTCFAESKVKKHS